MNKSRKRNSANQRSIVVFLFFLLSYLRMPEIRLKKKIEKTSVFRLFRIDQCKLYGEILRHAIVIIYMFIDK